MFEEGYIMANLPQEQTDSIIEPLTRREREILVLLESDMTGNEIAVKLTLAPSSIKWYTQQIYGKLGVNSRKQAILRARELGLLASPSHPIFPATSAPRHNLPHQLTRFIGHADDLARVKELVGKYPLVTLTGPGGVGKTRLSLQAGIDLLPAFPNGVWFVDLTALTDPSLIPHHTLLALGLRGLGGEKGALLQFLGNKRILLILDNCEHLIESCAHLSEELLQLCPGLKILATSREALRIAGERHFLVPSLSLPVGLVDDMDGLMHSDAVELFVERAASVEPRFSLTIENAEAIVRICRKLDGIPLAIELAAARVKVMSVEQIAARMDDLFRLLSTGSRTALPRHQTLRALIEWSYGLLSDEEQVVFRKLAVFSGGWSLEAAEAICAVEGIEIYEVLDLLSRLVDKSLVIKEEQSGAARFRMLETIRQFAEFQLSANREEAKATRDRHCEWFLELADNAGMILFAGGLDRLEREHDNLRAAIRWSLEMNQLQRAFQFVIILTYFWEIHDHTTEGYHWIRQTLELCEADSRRRGSHDWALVVIQLVLLGLWKKEFLSYRPLLEEALQICLQHNDFDMAGFAYNRLGFMDYFERKLSDAVKSFQLSVDMHQKAGDTRLAGHSMQLLGMVAQSQRDFQAMRAYNEASRELLKSTDDPFMRFMTARVIAEDQLYQGNLNEARALFHEGLEYSKTIGNQEGVVYCLCKFSLIACVEGEYAEAHGLASKSYALAEELPDIKNLIPPLIQLAEADWRADRFDSAREKAAQAVDLAKKVGSIGINQDALRLLGTINLYQENLDIARKCLEEAQKMSPDDAKFGLQILYRLAHVDRKEERYPEAKNLYIKCLNDSLKANARLHIPESVEGLAFLFVDFEKYELAARLFGMAGATREHIAYRLAPIQKAEIDAARARLRQTLSQPVFERLCEEGRVMTVEQALELAVAFPSDGFLL
jgi:predicted ATPase/DNA-binding CsgD family transcriptional regulator